MKHEILLGLTTTPRSDWRGKVEEMKKFGIKKIALFPTFLEIDERKELYNLLEQIDGLEILHMHLRNDMTLDELEYFKNRFKSKVFNIHPKNTGYDFSDEFVKYSSDIYIENLILIPKDEELSKYAGLCIDFSHWENNFRMKDSSYNHAMLDHLKTYTVGCCHVSAIKEEPYLESIDNEMRYDDHFYKKLEEFDYIEKYKKYLPKYISLELENSFEDQSKVKEYLEKMF